MTKERDKTWIQALQGSLRKNKEYSGWLKQALEEGRKLKLKVSVFGIPQRIKQLDIHDALSQIVDEMTNYLFPRQSGESTPQTKDRHFWEVEGEKFINAEEKVEIEIEKLNNETRIFKKFARLCPYPIDLNSIRHEYPPKPDISCSLSDGTTIAFELVECVDKSMAQSISDSLKLSKVFYDKLENLPKERKERFKVNFRDALIYVAFIRGISINKRKSSIPVIFDYLLTLESTAEGKFDLRSHPDFKNIVRWISIKRGKFAGPIFRVEAVTFFAEPAKEHVEDKFKKQYRTKYKTDLLAYYELQPEIPENSWLPALQEFVENSIKCSLFQWVWIYSATKNRIIFVYPGP